MYSLCVKIQCLFEQLTLVVSIIEPLLVDDGVNSNGSFATRDKVTISKNMHCQLSSAVNKKSYRGTKSIFILSPSLSVSDDQFSLSSANGDQTVHCLDTSLHRVTHRDTRDDAWSLHTHTTPLSNNGALYVCGGGGGNVEKALQTKLHVL